MKPGVHPLAPHPGCKAIGPLSTTGPSPLRGQVMRDRLAMQGLGKAELGLTLDAVSPPKGSQSNPPPGPPGQRQ